MIIKAAKLAPFAGIPNREQTFSPGLNVILGPNEAGKSTLVNAIFAALFVSPGVKKSSEDWKNFIRKCLPYPDGDTARVEIEIEAENRFHYSCSWGAASEERLHLEDGSEINDSQTIRSYLQDALRLGRSTYEEVLFARQEEMIHTLERLKDNAEVTGAISDLLRAAIFEAGGVSLEKLETAIKKEEEELLSNWDPDLDGPRGGRGIDNQHKTKIGKILEAYYDFETVRKKLKNARQAEDEVDELNRRLAEKAGDQDQLYNRLSEMVALEEDIRLRSTLEPQLETARIKESELKNIAQQWPATEEKVRSLEAKIDSEKQRIAAFEKELAEAEEVFAARQKRELLDEARPLHEKITVLVERLSNLPSLTGEDYNYLVKKQQEKETLKARLEAMKLTAKIKAEETLDLTVTAGLENPYLLKVEKETSLEAAGRLFIKAAGWSIEVQSGSGNADQVLALHGQVQGELEAKLSALGVKDTEEASSIHTQRRQLEEKLGRLRSELNGILRGESYDELAMSASTLGSDKPVRDPDQIRKDISDLKVNLGNDTYSIEQEKKKLRQWKEIYESSDKVIETLSDYRGKAREIEAALDRLKPLPAQYAAPEEFIADLKELREQVDSLKGTIANLRENLADARGRLPEETTEDLEETLQLAEAELNRLKSRGRALSLVKEEFYTLKEELDKDTLAPLIEAFARNLSVITGNRYTTALMEGAVPGEITSARGKTVPVDYLSTGTSGGVALALRLAMATYLLGDAAGFLVMDDPLVNLDPERRESAARLINEFAREKQVIITTCDPQTASLLGGNIIAMESNHAGEES